MNEAARIEALAQLHLQAWDRATLVPLPSAEAEGLTIEQAHAVAQRQHALREARGERRVGFKIGFTNRSLWARYGVHQPIWGPLWDTTAELLAGREATLSLAPLSQPRLEPEVVFGFAGTPRAGMSLGQLQGCIGWVAHGLEIVHCHHAGWRFSAADTVADFALHGRLRVGPRVAVRGWDTLADDLARLEIELVCNGEVKDKGIGSVVLDGPLHALKTWIDAMARATPHWQAQPGDIVTTGTITDAWPLEPGQRWQTRLSDARLAPLSLHTTA